jgi:hypothetical protein
MECMASSGPIDSQLLLAVLKVAKEECGHRHWDALEPVLKAAWEQLRAEDTPSWDVVADEVQAACRASGYLI